MGLPTFKWYMAADSESPEIGQISVDDSRYAMTIDVYMTKSSRLQHVNMPLQPWQIYGSILGYPVYVTNRVTGLSRNVPWQYPQHPHLWATQISNIKGRAFDSLRWCPITQMPFSQYQVLRMTILFTVPPYPILTDAQVGNWFGAEFYRYTETPDMEMSTEGITRKGVQWKFIRSRLGDLPPGMTQQQPLDIGITKRLVKAVFRFRWRHVPAIGFFGQTGWGIPRKLSNCMGRVNQFSWPPKIPPPIQNTIPGMNFASGEYPTGTMLMLNPKITKEAACVLPQIIAPPKAAPWNQPDNLMPYLPPRMVSVEMTMVYFDPPFHPQWTHPNVLEGQIPWRGHNLVPLPIGQNTTNSTFWDVARNAFGNPGFFAGGGGAVDQAHFFPISSDQSGNPAGTNPSFEDRFLLYQHADFSQAWQMN
jgi:hypothetical protein